MFSLFNFWTPLEFSALSTYFYCFNFCVITSTTSSDDREFPWAWWMCSDVDQSCYISCTYLRAPFHILQTDRYSEWLTNGHMTAVQAVWVTKESDAARAGTLLVNPKNGYVGGLDGHPVYHLVALVVQISMKKEPVCREFYDTRTGWIDGWGGEIERFISSEVKNK